MCPLSIGLPTVNWDPSLKIRPVGHGCRAEGKKAKAPFIRIDGDTPPSDRQRLVNDFQQQAGLKVAILSIKAAGTGLTLTVCFAYVCLS